MTTLQDLLEAILQNPSDDTLRMIYADKLVEEGYTKYADFIRCQVGIHRLGPPPINLNLLTIDPILNH